MPIVNRFADLHPEITAWRRELHQHPELLFDVQRTAGFVADKLRGFGVDQVVEGIGRTGVVGIINGKTQSSSRVIGLRADMDALPITETTGVAHASTIEGKMHACGHDGHTAMLLGAAKYLADTRNFNGSVAVIFQPAEEGGGGGNEMVKDGMMDRFDIDEVYGMHNWPGVEVGHFAIRPGPLMAAADQFDITVTGQGGHAAAPHRGIDPTVIAAQLVNSLQTVVSRHVDPLEAAVVSVTSFNTDTVSYNVIPQSVKLQGTVRTLDSEVRDSMVKRMETLIDNTAKAFGATAEMQYHYGYPVTVNHDKQTSFATEIATKIAGADKVDTSINPVMGAEDFSFMLQARPGAFIFTGNGNTALLHNSNYDFNDEAIPHGASYWVQLVETALAS